MGGSTDHAALSLPGRGRALANRAEHRGAAVVVAMLLAALATAIAATLLWQQQWNLRQHQFRREQVQAQSLVFAGLQWARQILQEDARSGAIDHLGEAWAVRLPPTPVENGEISGYIADQQALFNVNGLLRDGKVVDGQLALLRRILASAGIDPRIAAAFVDWLDADDSVYAEGGAEDAAYVEASSALPANRSAVRFAELASVHGMSPPAASSLRGVLTVLPTGTPINVNTAPDALLAALLPELPSEALQKVMLERARQPFVSVADFRTRAVAAAYLVPEEMLSVSSRYFLVTVVARQGETRAQGRALLRRSGSSLPDVVWQVIE